MLGNYILEEMIQVVDTVASVEEAIALCGDQLIKGNYINQAYVNSMIETYHEFGPYMVLVDKIALFHGKPGVGVNETAMCLTVLKEAYQLTNHEKKIKLCFAFSSIDKENHMEMIQSFASFLMNNYNVDALLQATTKEEVIAVIKREE